MKMLVRAEVVAVSGVRSGERGMEADCRVWPKQLCGWQGWFPPWEGVRGAVWWGR